MKIVLVHGFNVRDGGERSIDRLAAPLQAAGHTVDTDGADYGYFGLLGVRMFNGNRRQQVLERLARAFSSADLVITHSNGANFTNQAALEIGCRRRLQVVHISPALNMNTGPAAAVARQLVYHTMRDGWVRLARWLPWHPWGAQGAYGYQGADPRVTNRPRPQVDGHSAWFTDDHRDWLVKEILEWAI